MALAARHRADHWQACWVILDDLETPMSLDVQNFVSGLIGADVGPTTLDETTKRFRWMFLGRVPGFLTDSEMTIEQLDPHSLTEDELFRTRRPRRLARDSGEDRSDDDLRKRARYLLAASTTLSQSQSIPVPPVAQQFVAMEISTMTEGATG